MDLHRMESSFKLILPILNPTYLNRLGFVGRGLLPTRVATHEHTHPY